LKPIDVGIANEEDSRKSLRIQVGVALESGKFYTKKFEALVFALGVGVIVNGKISAKSNRINRR